MKEFENTYELGDGGILEPQTPYDEEVNSFLLNESAKEQAMRLNGKHPEIAMLEKIFKVEITGVLNSYWQNGRIKSILECRNAAGGYAELETDISEEARYSLPVIFDNHRVKKSAWARWINGEYPVEDWLENLIVYYEETSPSSSESSTPRPFPRSGEGESGEGKSRKAFENALKLQKTQSKTVDGIKVVSSIPNSQFPIPNSEQVSCAVCSRKLTNAKSVRLQIGPECRKRIGVKGATLLHGNVVSNELLQASRLYHEEQFQKWIIRACLTLDAPLPVKKLKWMRHEWFGYRNHPILYYVDANGTMNRLDTSRRKLCFKRVTDETAETELDFHALQIKGKSENAKRTIRYL